MRKKNQKLMMELLTDNRGNCCFIGFTNFMQFTRKKNQELMMELLNDREKNVEFFCLTLSMYFVFLILVSCSMPLFSLPCFLAHRAGCCLALSV